MMEFTEEEIRDVFKLLSAVLQMGNIEFMTAGGAQITSKGGRRTNITDLKCVNRQAYNSTYMYFSNIK